MNEIVKFTANGETVEITPADVRNVLCPNATDKEISLFLELCKAQHLNPWIKDAYLVKYGSSPATIITGKEVFTKRAAANEAYEGFEAGVTVAAQNGQIVRREGSAVFAAAGETLLGGWCRVHVKGRRPFFEEVALAEYSTGKSGWAKMPGTMIRKVALVHALREAFPDEFQGCYAAEEMGENGAMVLDGEAVQQQQPKAQHAAAEPAQSMADVEFVEMASDAQCIHITDLIEEFAKMRGKTVSDVFSAVFSNAHIINLGVEAGREFTAAQAEEIIKLLDYWIAKADEHDAEETAAKLAEYAADAEAMAQEPLPVMEDEDIVF